MATASFGRTSEFSPCDTIRHAGWHATEWTLVTFDGWVRKIGVNNQGAGSVWVSRRGLSAARNATDHQVEVRAGTTVDFAFSSTGAPTLSIWGADGAAHPIGFITEG